MRKTLAFIAISTLSVVPATIAHADRELPPIRSEKPEVAELRKQLRDPRTPPMRYWDKVAVCESSLNGTTARWNDGGKWAGGLGIYTKGKFGDKDMGTWERWGGEQFAPTPAKATRLQQIVVANRIAVHGWSTTIYRDPKVAKIKGIPVVWEYAKKKVGFFGWGCIKNRSSLHPRKWVKKYGS